MKRVIGFMIVVVMLALLLCACGKETFRCGWCTKVVTQSPHTVTAFGQEVKVCDDCYEVLKQYMVR